MVRHENVDSRGLCLAISATARRSAVDRHDDRRARFASGSDRGQRQAVALVEPARDVRNDLDAEATQGDREDCQAGQSVRIEVAEDEDPLAGCPCSGDPCSERLRIRQEPRIVEAGHRVRKELVEGGPIEQPAAGQEAHHTRVEVVPLPCLENDGVDGDRLRKQPAIAGLDHDIKDATSRFIVALSVPTSGCGAIDRPVRRSSGDRATGPRGAGRGRATVPPIVPFLPDHEDRSGVEDRGVGPGDDPE